MFHLVASGQNSGTLGSITSSPSIVDIPAGALIAFFCSAAVANNAYSGLSDNAGVGNVYSLTSLTLAGINESALLGSAVAAAKTPAGTAWTATFVSGTPGGRMFSVGYFNDALGVAPILDKNPTVVGAASAQSNSISTSGGLAQAQELVVAACAMRGVASTDVIVLDGSLTPMDNRNHTGTTTAYQAWGYKVVNSVNDVSDNFAFGNAADNSIVGMQTFKLAIPSPPAPSSYAPNPIIHPGYHGV